MQTRNDNSFVVYCEGHRGELRVSLQNDEGSNFERQLYERVKSILGTRPENAPSNQVKETVRQELPKMDVPCWMGCSDPDYTFVDEQR